MIDRRLIFLLILFCLVPGVLAQANNCDLSEWELEIQGINKIQQEIFTTSSDTTLYLDFSRNFPSKTSTPYLVKMRAPYFYDSEQSISVNYVISDLYYFDDSFTPNNEDDYIPLANALNRMERTHSPFSIELSGVESKGKQIAKLFLIVKPDSENIELRAQFRSDELGIKKLKRVEIPISELVTPGKNYAYIEDFEDLTLGIDRIEDRLEYYYSLKGVKNVIYRSPSVQKVPLYLSVNQIGFNAQGESANNYQEIPILNHELIVNYEDSPQCVSKPSPSNIPEKLEICTAEELTNLRSLLSSSTPINTKISLTCDIDLENVEFTPFEKLHAEMIFDGRGHTISNLNIDERSKDNVGLFRVVEGNIINLNLKDATVEGKNNVGLLAGKMDGVIRDVMAENVVIRGNNNVGGLIGKAGILKIEQVGLLNLDLVANSLAGGLVGKSEDLKALYSFVKGKVTANSEIAGGLVGEMSDPSKIFFSYAEVDLTAQNIAGGLLGHAIIDHQDGYITGGPSNSEVEFFSSSIVHSYSSSRLQVQGNTKGGIVAKKTTSPNTVTSLNVQDVFYDKEKAGTDIGFLGNGKTTSEMLLFSTYEKFNPAIWLSNDNSLPELFWRRYQRAPQNSPVLYYNFENVAPLIGLGAQSNFGSAIIDSTDYVLRDSQDEALHQYPNYNEVAGFEHDGAVAQFSSTDDFFNTEYDFDFDKDWTISMFIYPETKNSNRQIIVGKYNIGGASSPVTVYLRDGFLETTIIGYTGEINQAGQKVRATKKIVSNTEVPLDQWSHIGVTYDGEYIKLHINGARDKTIGTNYEPYLNDAPVMIGARPQEGEFRKYTVVNYVRSKASDLVLQENYEGAINYFKLYDRTLTSSELAAQSNLFIN